MDNTPLLSLRGVRRIHVTLLNVEGVSVLCTSPSTPAMNVNAPCTTPPVSTRRHHRIVRKECEPSIVSHVGRYNSCFVGGVNVKSLLPFPSQAGDTTQRMFRSDRSACKR